MADLARMRMRCRAVVSVPEKSPVKQHVTFTMDVNENINNYPSGRVDVVITNPDVFDKFEYGVEYNIDINSIEVISTPPVVSTVETKEE